MLLNKERNKKTDKVTVKLCKKNMHSVWRFGLAPCHKFFLSRLENEKNTNEFVVK